MAKRQPRLPAQQVHVTLGEGSLCVDGMSIEFDVDINDLPETVVNVLNRANFIGIEGRDEATVGFHVREESPCE